jgi:hypothetical protein
MSNQTITGVNKIVSDILTFKDTVKNLTVTAKTYASYDTGKVNKIENGEVTLDGGTIASFRTIDDPSMLEEPAKNRIQVDLCPIEYIGMVGAIIADFITAADGYFKPVTTASY